MGLCLCVYTKQDELTGFMLKKYLIKTKKVIVFITIYAFLLAGMPARAYLPPLSNAQLYTLAVQGNVRALRAAVQRGLNIDSLDRYGNTALCHSIIKRNYTAYNTLRAAGANPHHPCIQNIANGNYDSFVASRRVVPATANSRQAYAYVGDDDTIWTTGMWATAGAVLLGGIIALVLSSSGGGNDDFVPYETTDYSLAGVVGTERPDYPQDYPYNPIILLEQNGNTIVNGYYPDYNLGGDAQEGWVISNDASIDVEGEDGSTVSTPLTDLIDFNKSALEYSDYIQVAMKATYGSTANNGYAYDDPMYDVDRHYLISLKDNTTALAAFKDSFANNYSQINIDAKNGTIGMIGSINSTVTNQTAGQINMTFRGDKDNHSVIGMYADTNSTAINEGVIYGQAQSPDSIAGTLTGMRGQLLNQENPRTSQTYIKNRGTIKLEASANNRNIKTSLVGMGSWLEDDFLNGAMYLSRAGFVYLDNLGSIILNVALTGENGTYSANSEDGTSALLQGTGGIVGMRADGNTIATNDGLIQINIEDEGKNTVTNNHAGMQSVHGGKIVNNNTIEINGGEGGYGMLAVRGEGNNPEFDAVAEDVSTVMINNGNIIVNSENSYAMKSYTGGSSTNTGTITFNVEGVAIEQNTGTIANRSDIIMNAGGIGLKMNQKGDIINDLYNTDNSLGTIYIDNTLSNNVSSGEEGDSGEGSGDTSGQKESIGIYLEDGTVLNKGTIEMVNTKGATGNISYGIKAEKGSITSTNSISISDTYDSYGIAVKEGSIENSGAVSLLNTRGTLDHLGYALKNDYGLINNSGALTIVNKDNAYGIASGSGIVNNTGKIDISSNTGTSTALAYGIQSGSGSVTSSNDISISNANDSYGIDVKAGNVGNSGAITLTNTNGSVDNSGYGINSAQGDVSNSGVITIANKKEAYAITAANGYVTNEADLILNGNAQVLATTGYGIKSSRGGVTNKGNVTITNTTDSYGVSADNGDLTNTGSIDMHNTSGALEGLGYGLKTGTGNISNNAQISISNKNQAYALFTDTGRVVNDGSLIIAGNTGASTDAYGIKSTSGLVENNGNVTITDTKNSYGVATENGDITNTGIIDMHSSGNALEELGYGLLGGKSNIVNKAAINIRNKNNAYAISNTSGTITNDAALTINGNENSLSALGYGIKGGFGAITNTAGITITNTKDSYGVWTENGNITNSGSISLADSSGSIEGIGYGIRTGHGFVNNTANISIKNKNEAYAISDESGDVDNDGTLTINGNKGVSTNAYGIKVASGAIDNSAQITITDTQNSYGVSTDNGDITNSGIINMYSSDGSLEETGYGLKAGTPGNGTDADAEGSSSTGGGNITNTGEITIKNKNNAYAIATAGGTVLNQAALTINGNAGALSAQAYGIQSANGAVTNEGAITITNTQDSYAISADNGDITNTGTILLQNSTGAAEGIGYGLKTGNGNIKNDATITIENKTEAYGIVSTTQGNIDSNAAINITNSTGAAAGIAYGIKGGTGYVNSNSTINITNANEGYGIAVDNGVVTSNADITLTNTQQAQNKTSYGIKAEKGSVLNNANIYMNVTGDLTAETGNDSGSFGIWGNEANITNSANSEIVFSLRGNGMHTVSGSNDNYGSIHMQKGGTGMSTDSGNAINHDSGTITIDDTGVGMASGNGKATNDGQINITGTMSTGMESAKDAENNGTILITGYNSTGMSVVAENGSIVNNKDIIINTSHNGLQNYGMYGSTGVYSRMNNKGNITITGRQYPTTENVAYGMYLDEGEAQNNGIITLNDIFGYGMYLGTGGTLDNYGTIALNYGGVGMGANGTVSEGKETVAMINHTGGTITTNGQYSYGMYGLGTATAWNDGTLTIGGEDSYGIYTTDGSGTNTSTITMSDANSVGMHSVNADSINKSTGTITIQGENSVGMQTNNGGTTDTSLNGSVNEGTINLEDTATGSTGMTVVDGSGKVKNKGTINVGSTSSSGMLANGDGGTVDNSGDITVTGENSYGMQATQGTATNNKNITISADGGIGMFADGGNIVNGTNGTINLTEGNNSTYAMYVESGTADNQGKINLSKADVVGIFAESGTAENNGTINLSGDNSVAMRGRGDAQLTNNSGRTYEVTYDNLAKFSTTSGIIISGNNSIGMEAGGSSTVTNARNGVITVNGPNSKGMVALGVTLGQETTYGTATNQGIILVNDASSEAMYADGGIIVNDTDGMIYTNGDYAMNVHAGSGTNKGYIRNDKGNFTAMYAEAGKIDNQGRITLNGDNSKGMVVNGSATASNSLETSRIEVNGSNSIGMQAIKGTATNNGVIDVNATDSTSVNMQADGGTIINSSTGTLSSSAVDGVVMLVNEGSGDNQGTINLDTQGITAMRAKNGTITNSNAIIINGPGATGMEAINGTAQNNGTITVGSNGSNGYAIAVNGNGSATNNGTIVVEATDAYAMYTDGGKITNASGATITTNGSSAMYVKNGQFENNGDISNSNNNFHAIHIENGTGLNAGSITLTGNSAAAIYALQSENLESTGEINMSGNSAIGIYLGSGTLTSSSEINMGAGTNSYGIQGGTAVTINNSGNINGSGTGIIGINVEQGNVTNNGATIELTGDNSVGINVGSGGADNSGTISVKANSGTIGMQTQSGTLNNLDGGTIDVVGTGSRGMYASGSGSLSNRGTINASGEGTIGMLSNGGNVGNHASLTVSGINAVGMSGVGGTLTNGESGIIDVDGSNAIGMQITGGGQAVNNGSLTVQGQFGMYAAGGSTITNSGTITLENGTAAMRAVDTSWAYNNGTIILVDGGEWGICDTPGHCVTNSNGQVIQSTSASSQSARSLSLGTMNLSQGMAVGLGGNYAASVIKGDLAVYGDATLEGSKTQYTLANALTASDISKLNVRGTAWFNQVSIEESNDAVDTDAIVDEINKAQAAKENADETADNSGTVVVAAAQTAAPALLSAAPATAEEENEVQKADTETSGLDDLKNYNITVSKGDLNEILAKEEGIEDKSLLDKLDAAYEAGAESDVFDEMKYAYTNSQLNHTIVKELGLDFFGNFAKQNLDVIRSASRQINSSLFNNKETKDVRLTAGYDFSGRKQDSDIYQTDYEDKAYSIFGMLDKKFNEKFRYGIGVLLTRYESEYDDSMSKRNEFMVQVLTPLIAQFDKTKLISVPRLGIGFGDYDRVGSSQLYDGDTTNYYYGITNELRHNMDFGWFGLEPTLEFNVLGMYQDRIKEDGVVDISSSNNLSIEGGVGLYASKLFEFGEAHSLKLRAGGTYYHEFGDPYRAQKARLAGTDVSYRINSYNASRGRGVVSFRADYKYNQFDLYGEFTKFIEDNGGYAINAGMGYRF